MIRPINDSEDIVRFLRPKHLTRQGHPMVNAFILRKLPSGIDEDYASVMRYGYQGYYPSIATCPLKNAIGFLQFNAGRFRELETPTSLSATIVPKPTASYPSHAGLYVYLNGTIVKGECVDNNYRRLLQKIIDISTLNKWS
ncbi:MAG: hypothetical protein LIP03_07985 [Bacteroidales bacterium]|nr:hypothetical protein [Bacteroidales bacterium]